MIACNRGRFDMAVFCPTCGLENQADRNFCRGCGTNLRVVQTALAMGLTSDPETDSLLTTKKRAAEILCRKISEFQIKKADDLRKVIEELEKFMESDEVRKARHLRNAVITVATVAGGICFFGLAFLKDSGAPPGLMMALVSLFFAVVVPALLFMLYRLGRAPRQPKDPPSRSAQANSVAIRSTITARPSSASITEHTTRQLDVQRPRMPTDERP